MRRSRVRVRQVQSGLLGRTLTGTLAGKILNVLEMDWVSISQVLCPFPCDVLVMYQPGKLALVPSER